MYKALFIAPYLGELEMDLQINFSNAPRESDHFSPCDLIISGFVVDKNGNKIEEIKDFIVKNNSHAIFFSNSLKKIEGDKNYNLIFNIALHNISNEKHFVREHQIVHIDKKTSKFGSFLADNLLALPQDQNVKLSEIVLLGHKCWVSDDIDCYTICSHYRNDQATKTKHKVVLLDEGGNQIIKKELSTVANYQLIIDIKSLLQEANIKIQKEPKFYNLLIKSHGGRYCIYNVLKNNKNNNITCEHSLPPYYYTNSSQLKELRQQMVNNFFIK